MNFNQFSEFLSRFLWRDGDTALNVDIGNLIRMGENRLNRDLRVEQMIRVQTTDLHAESTPLPSDFLEMRTIHAELNAPFQTSITYVAPHVLQQRRFATRSARFQPIYSTTGTRLQFAGPMTPENPVTVVLTYYGKVPKLAETDESWLTEDFLDLYAYACLLYTAPFLRDDERLALWRLEYDTMLAAANDSNTRARFAGSPLTMQLPGIVR